MIEFGRLLETEIPRLRRYPRALTRDPSRADDLVQDTLLRAIAATDPTGGLSLRDLDRALARISEAQRRITLLIGLEGTSYEEASTILDVPVGTIRSGLSRGRKSLRELMDRRDWTGTARHAAIHERRIEAPTPRPGRRADSEFFSGGDVAV
jgi:RNA polymerase sigma-70 factor (ECF subfamily)